VQRPHHISPKKTAICFYCTRWAGQRGPLWSSPDRFRQSFFLVMVSFPMAANIES
jgi:hypothetical protein